MGVIFKNIVTTRQNTVLCVIVLRKVTLNRLEMLCIGQSIQTGLMQTKTFREQFNWVETVLFVLPRFSIVSITANPSETSFAVSLIPSMSLSSYPLPPSPRCSLQL